MGTLEALGKGLVSAIPTVIGNGIGAWSQQRANDRNIEAQEAINQANLEHANYWNQKNYELASEAQRAQLAQQNWANEQYIENRDYERQLQQEIFHREDTALQRSLQQATDAGFSPLAALGINTGAGSVVSMSSAPGSMVSNNQASVQGAGQVAPRVEALTRAEGFSQIGAMLATMAEGDSMREHQSDMQQADFAQRLKELGNENFSKLVIEKMHQDFLKDQDNQEYLYRIAEKMKDFEIQQEILKIVHGHEKDMQTSQQTHQENMQISQQTHQENMQTSQQTHQENMQTSQQNWLSSNANNQGSGRGLHDITRDLIDTLADGDGRVARWLRENSDVISLIVEGVEYIVGIGAKAQGINQEQQRVDNDTMRTLLQQ